MSPGESVSEDQLNKGRNQSMDKHWLKLAAACVVATPLMFLNGMASSQTVGNESVAKMPPNPAPSISPKADIIPGIRLSNNDGRILGVVHHVIRHGNEDFALVSVGEGTSKSGNALVAVPVDGMRTDGQEIKYDISWARYSELPGYNGSAPTWMVEKN
jgi:hypothetical protein